MTLKTKTITMYRYTCTRCGHTSHCDCNNTRLRKALKIRGWSLARIDAPDLCPTCVSYAIHALIGEDKDASLTTQHGTCPPCPDCKDNIAVRPYKEGWRCDRCGKTFL